MTDDEAQDNPLKQELEAQVEENRATLQSLAREGINIDPGSIDAGRHQFFIERLIQSLDEDERYQFEIAWQKQVAEVLKNTGRHARYQRLLQGGHKPKGGAPTILHPGSANGGRPDGN